MTSGDIRQSLNREVILESVDVCNEATCERLHIMHIGEPHLESEEDQTIFLNIHCQEASFAIPKNAMCTYVSSLRASPPRSKFFKISGLDANGERRHYCITVDESLQWQFVQQIGECLGPKAFATALKQL